MGQNKISDVSNVFDQIFDELIKLFSKQDFILATKKKDNLKGLFRKVES